MRNLAVCITNALKRADKEKFTTILFPLLGTGTGGAGLDQTVRNLFQAPIHQLKQNQGMWSKKFTF
ncbi:macro domain-containing protein [Nitrosomonas marina]|uniref:macro domain-containing protein n=1 Tax=Nitrosomonas marina TaxID=917 RepID=UPI0015A584E6